MDPKIVSPLFSQEKPRAPWVLILLNKFFIWRKMAVDLIDFLRFIAILRFLAIFCDFFLGNQISHREKSEEDCKDPFNGFPCRYSESSK